MKSKKIVITGGPGTGKTSIIEALKAQDYLCYDEISRQVTLEAREAGIEQLFLTEPLLFSQKLLEGRMAQYNEAKEEQTNVVFLDRGIPDVIAYMDFIGDTYPEEFVDACENHAYDKVFILPPWKGIFSSDSERYETFEQAEIIHTHLYKTYQKLGYDLQTVPLGTVKERVTFILQALNL